jgi:hypothetical protein
MRWYCEPVPHFLLAGVERPRRRSTWLPAWENGNSACTQQSDAAWSASRRRESRNRNV